MTPKLKPPYLKKIDNRGQLIVWQVDGSYIRTNIDEEFTNFGQHFRYSFIPENELWIDQEADPNEQKFFLEHLLVEHRLMAKSKPYNEAIELADRAERNLRRQAGDLKKITDNGKNLPDPKKMHKRLWRTLLCGVNVWIIEGREVRSIFDIDFTEGGHDYVYEFIPDNEVWIDDDIIDEEREYVLLHELHERNLMAKGWIYDQAHESASRLEYHCRHFPDELHDALVKEGWA